MIYECKHEWDQVEKDRQDTARGVSTRTVLQCVRCGAYHTREEFTAHPGKPSELPAQGMVVYLKEKTVLRYVVSVEAEDVQSAVRKAHEIVHANDVTVESVSHELDGEVVEREKPEGE